MDDATVVFSRRGIFQTMIAARDVRSRGQARKLWPQVSPGASRQMVTWVSPSFEDGKLRRRSHFRVLPAQHTFNPKAHFDDEEASRWRAKQESPEHRRANELVAAELSRRLNAGLAVPWVSKDADASDNPLEGNLLLGADRVATDLLWRRHSAANSGLTLLCSGRRSRPCQWCWTALKSNLATPSMDARR